MAGIRTKFVSNVRGSMKIILIGIARKQSGSVLAKAVSLAVRASQSSIDQKQLTAYGAPMRKIMSKDPSSRTTAELSAIVRFLSNFEKFQSFSQVVATKSIFLRLNHLNRFADSFDSNCCKTFIRNLQAR
jgi:hypothetical protein